VPAYNVCVVPELYSKLPRSMATWAFIFLWLGCLSIAAILFFSILAGKHLIANDTVEGLAMAVGLTIAPLCVITAIVLAAWHLVRKWTGTEQPSIKLGLAEERRSAGEPQDD
jgi:formate hydrogenlyase subunit 3/multisubunit Na+/H+ antiporter MnhD subunit